LGRLSEIIRTTSPHHPITSRTDFHNLEVHWGRGRMGGGGTCCSYAADKPTQKQTNPYGPCGYQGSILMAMLANTLCKLAGRTIETLKSGKPEPIACEAVLLHVFQGCDEGSV
jgi:hypothetical protein